MKNLVSIIIPFYNRVSSVERAINSALIQTYKNKEIILINDCSNDSIENIKKLVEKHKELNLFSNQKNLGASYSRNIGMRFANGEFIAFLDSDDEWLSFKLDVQINYMIKNKIDISYTSYLRKISKNNKINIIRVGKNHRIPFLAFKCDIATPTVVVRKRITKDFLFNTEINFGEDVIYWYEIGKKFRIFAINIPTTIVNISNNSSSNNLSKQKKGFENINKYLFKRKKILGLIHKIYFELNIFFKRLMIFFKNHIFKCSL